MNIVGKLGIQKESLTDRLCFIMAILIESIVEPMMVRRKTNVGLGPRIIWNISIEMFDRIQWL